MLKRVQIYTNRIYSDLSPLLTYAYQYNLKHGVELHFDITQVNVTGYKSVQVKNASGNYVWALSGAEPIVPQSDHDVTIFIYDQAEWKAPWYSPFPLRSDTPTGICTLYANKPFISLPYYAPRASDTNIMLIHELLHAYTELANLAGIPTADQMDNYIDNAFPDSPTGNFAVQWKLLSNWLKPMNITSTAQVTFLTKWGLVPQLEALAQKFLTLALFKGYSLKITQGFRDPAYQDKLYAQGRTLPGNIVTNATSKTSKHCLGKAFDIAFTGAIPYPANADWKAIGAVGKSLGLTWGGDFKSFVDLLHFEI